MNNVLSPIEYPSPSEVIPYHSFAAFGHVAPGQVQVRCLLLDSRGLYLLDGTVIHPPDPTAPDPTFWSAAFTSVPTLVGPYSILLRDMVSGATLGTSAGFDILTAPGATKIIYPAGSPVPRSFTAFGPTNRQNVSGEMVPSVGASWNGDLAAQGDAWYLTFLNLSGNTKQNPWQLNVYDDLNPPPTPADSLAGLNVA
jgi:hypothetical protein